MSTPQKITKQDHHWPEVFAFWAMLGYFGVKALFFALKIRERVFPDEASWLGTVQVFSHASWLPIDSPESYHLGLMSHLPSLYFWLMGKLLACNIWQISDLLFLRVANVLLCLLTVGCAWRLARLLALPLASRLIFLLMLTNTMMFTFIAGAVSYDNLATLLAVLALTCLIRFQQDRTAASALGFGLAILAGTLTKNVMIPYGVGLLALFLIYERQNILPFCRRLPTGLSAWHWREFTLLALCLVALTANGLLYGGNLLRFGVLLPNMEMVLPVEACLQNRLFTRDYAAREFKAGKRSLLDAQRLALSIRDPGDRASAWEQLNEAATAKAQAPKQVLGRLGYAVEWAQVIVARTYSVAAHLSLFKQEADFYPYYALFILATGMWLLRLRDLWSPGLAGVAAIFLFYTTILMQVVNYAIYRDTGFSGRALTGRYLFPVLIPLYLLTAHALFSKMPRWWQLSAGTLVAIFFVWGEFPWFYRLAGPEWYF